MNQLFSREAFEAFLTPSLKPLCSEDAFRYLQLHGGTYASTITQEMFDCWQACVAIAQVELEKKDAEIATLKAQLKASPWISVNDQLPREFLQVTVYVCRYSYQADYLSHSHMQGGKWMSNEGNARTITHWCPLPPEPGFYAPAPEVTL